MVSVSSRFVAVLAVVAASLVGCVASAQAQTESTHAVQVGTFSFSSVSGGSGGAGGVDAPEHEPMNKLLRHTTSSQVPRVAGTAIGAGTGGAVGFNGLDDFQQTAAGTGAFANSQLDSTPPDQGLCVGNGFVVEAINSAMRVYTPGGTPLTPAVALNQFVGTTPETDNGGPPFGEFLSDPRCYYDPDTGRWFLTVLGIALDPATGDFGSSARQFIAVSDSSDPSANWTIYAFPTTDDGTDGTPSDPGCPCFGDQPLLGADANGVYIATNEYSITGPAFNGAQIYAMSKEGLETGTNTTVTHLQPGMSSSITNTLGGVAFSVQPATSPASGYDPAANGTEYFVSSQDFGVGPAIGTRANSVAVWSLTNTASLNAATPNLGLNAVVVPSEEYTQPPNAVQEPGTLVTNKRLPLVAGNDDRMNQVVYADGHLWSGVNTAVKTPQGPTLDGLAWFVTTPSTASDGTVSATMAKQGYLAVNKEDLLFPSIGVTPAGKATIAFTLVGPDYHPSAAWAPLSLSSGTGPVQIAAAGQNAQDDYSALKAYQGIGVSRWGDYTAAVSDPSGNVWMGVEYISGVERTLFANWATYLFHVTP
jgi:hypothetical protein